MKNTLTIAPLSTPDTLTMSVWKALEKAPVPPVRPGDYGAEPDNYHAQHQCRADYGKPQVIIIDPVAHFSLLLGLPISH